MSGFDNKSAAEILQTSILIFNICYSICKFESFKYPKKCAVNGLYILINNYCNLLCPYKTDIYLLLLTDVTSYKLKSYLSVVSDDTMLLMVTFKNCQILVTLTSTRINYNKK